MGVQVLPSIEFNHLPSFIPTVSKKSIQETVARMFGVPPSARFAHALQKAFLLAIMTWVWLFWDVFQGDGDLVNLDE